MKCVSQRTLFREHDPELPSADGQAPYEVRDESVWSTHVPVRMDDEYTARPHPFPFTRRGRHCLTDAVLRFSRPAMCTAVASTASRFHSQRVPGMKRFATRKPAVHAASELNR